MSEPYYSDDTATLYLGDALTVASDLESGSVNCIVTSPPYFGLRDYGEPGQYGLESSLAEYVETMRALFAELRRVLADDGTLWLNLGDSYQSSGGREGVGKNARVGSTLRQASGRTRPTSNLPAKNLLGIPWRVAFALQDDGWTLRNAIVWHKPNAMPESVADRLSSRYEQVFLFSKSRRYHFDLDAIREPTQTEPHAIGDKVSAAMQALGRQPHGRLDGQLYENRGRNPGDVWSINTRPFTGAHFAVMPINLAERCIQAGCKPGGTVLDPFSGSGTTGLAAARHGRRYVGIDLNREYLDLSLRTRLAEPTLDFQEAADL